MKFIEQKRKEAQEREKNYRSPQAQLDHLNKAGFVAKKERAKLETKLKK